MRTLTKVSLYEHDRSAELDVPGEAPGTKDLLPHLKVVSVRELLREPWVLTLQPVTGSASAAADPPFFANRRVVRLTFDDLSVEEYRIRRAGRELSGERPPGVTAEVLWSDLAARPASRVLTGGFVDYSFILLRRTGTELLTEIMASAPAPFVAGSAGAFAAEIASIRSIGNTHLDLLFQLAQELEAEWEAIYNSGTDKWEINLVDRVGGPVLSRPVEGVGTTWFNRRTIERTSDYADYFSRVVPLGGNDDEVGTIAQAPWSLASAVFAAGETTLTFDESIIYVDGSPEGAGDALEFGNDTDGFFAVVSTNVPDEVVVTGDASVLTSGRFRRVGGDDLTYLADPTAEAAAGRSERVLRRTDISPFANLLEAAGVSTDLSAWTAGVPDGFQVIGAPVIVQSTDPRYASAGDSAALITADRTEGIRTVDIALTPAGTAVYFSAFASIRVVTGSARMELVDADGVSHPLDEPALAVEDTLRALAIGGQRPAAGNGFLRWVAEEDGTQFALDSVTLTNSGVPIAFAPSMGPNALWHAAGALLALEGGVRPDRYEGEVIDTSAVPASGTEELHAGTTVQLEDSAVLLSTRILELTRRHKDQDRGPGLMIEKRLLLSRSRLDLIDFLKAPRAPDRQLPDTPPVVDIPAGFLEWGVKNDGDPVVFGWVPNFVLFDSVVKIITLPLPITQANPDELVRAVTASTPGATHLVLPLATRQFSVPIPADGFKTWIRHEPRDVRGVFDERSVKTVVLDGEGVVGDAPITLLSRISDDGTTCHGYILVQTEAGVQVASVTVEERFGGAAGTSQPTDRTKGDPSLVLQTRNLVDGEWEHDLPLHQTREGQLVFTVTFTDGSSVSRELLCPRNTAPDLEVAEFGGPNGRNPLIEGDVDTLSVRVFKVGDLASYDEERDGRGLATLPEAPDPGTGVVHPYTFQARAASRADYVDGVTAVAERDVPLSGGGAVGPQWERDVSGVITGVTVTAPAAGSAQVTIGLDSDAVAVDVRVYAWWIFEGVKSTTTEITGSLDKAINETAIEAGDTYIWTSPFTRISSGSLVRLFIIAEIENGVPNVIDTHEVEAAYNGSLA